MVVPQQMPSRRRRHDHHCPGRRHDPLGDLPHLPGCEQVEAVGWPGRHADADGRRRVDGAVRDGRLEDRGQVRVDDAHGGGGELGGPPGDGLLYVGAADLVEGHVSEGRDDAPVEDDADGASGGRPVVELCGRPLVGVVSEEDGGRGLATRTASVCMSAQSSSAISAGWLDQASASAKASIPMSRLAASASTTRSSLARSHGSEGTGPRSMRTSSWASVQRRWACDRPGRSGPRAGRSRPGQQAQPTAHPRPASTAPRR